MAHLEFDGVRHLAGAVDLDLALVQAGIGVDDVADLWRKCFENVLT